jgi:hypothetical protein
MFRVAFDSALDLSLKGVIIFEVFLHNLILGFLLISLVALLQHFFDNRWVFSPQNVGHVCKNLGDGRF